jgi:hypothetical protein
MAARLAIGASAVTRLQSDIDDLISAGAREYPQNFHEQKPLLLF